MNITFNSENRESWTLTNDKIICGEKEFPLSSIILIRYATSPNKNSTNGVFTIYFGKNISECKHLVFLEEERLRAQEAADFLRNFIGDDRFIDVMKEPNSKKMLILDFPGKRSAGIGCFFGLVIILALIIFLFVKCSESKSSSKPDENNNGGYYDKYDYDNDDNINQNEWEDALGDYMDNLENLMI